ncbi:MAG: cyclic nucleotide-binding domain-containing protein [Beijerinckiaceae bacterium]
MSLDNDIIQLTANPVLAHFEVEALRLLAFNSDTRILRQGDVLFREGDVSDGGYFIVSGSLHLIGEGTEETHVAGALVGETALFVETIRPATATALEVTTIRRIPRHLIRRILAEYPDTGRAMRSSFQGRIAELDGKLRRIDQMLPEDQE